jgi:hypothetical protein
MPGKSYENHKNQCSGSFSLLAAELSVHACCYLAKNGKMNHIQLNMNLCRKSPFILKTEIDREDRLSFNWNHLAFNEKVIGWYAIEENDDYINVMLHAEDYKLKDTFVIVLDYNDKPILLTDAEKPDKLFNKSPELDSLLKLIPEKQYLADEKAEL